MPLPLALATVLLVQAPPAPASAPEEPRGLRLATPAAAPGYTLYTPLASKYTYLVDLEGRVVQRWTSAYSPSSVYLLDDGSILRTGQMKSEVFEGGGMCGRIERIAWDGTLVWEYEVADDYQMQHHDAHPMPNGNVLVIAWEHRYYEDCVAAGRDPAHTGPKGLWPDAVLEVKPTLPSGGEVVWEWHAWDHLVQDFDPEADNFGVVAASAGRLDVNYDHRGKAAPTAEELAAQAELEEQMRALGYSGEDEDEEEEDAGPAPRGRGTGADWMHTNAVDYDPVHDLIALSSPNLSEVWIIDHSTTTEQAAGSSGGRFNKGGDILWRWGNPKNHGAGTPEDQKLFFQHNVQFIAPGLPGAGNLLVFNNGQERAAEPFSSVDELVLPFDPARGFVREGPDAHGPFGPAAPVWSYVAPDPKSFYAPFISGCQRLANGNTLVIDGPQGRIFEVQPDGTLAWDYWNPHGGDMKADGVSANALFRARRIAPDHPALAGKTLAPLELEPER
jgi:hypothetical protein